MKHIYEPRGKAKEYGDLALNIYTARRSQGLTGKPKFKWHKAESDAKTAAE